MSQNCIQQCSTHSWAHYGAKIFKFERAGLALDFKGNLLFYHSLCSLPYALFFLLWRMLAHLTSLHFLVFSFVLACTHVDRNSSLFRFCLKSFVIKALQPNATTQNASFYSLSDLIAADRREAAHYSWRFGFVPVSLPKLYRANQNLDF